MPIFSILILLALPMPFAVAVILFRRWLATRQRPQLFILMFSLAYALGLILVMIPGFLLRDADVLGWIFILIVPLLLTPEALPAYFALQRLGIPRFSLALFWRHR